MTRRLSTSSLKAYRHLLSRKSFLFPPSPRLGFSTSHHVHNRGPRQEVFSTQGRFSQSGPRDKARSRTVTFAIVLISFSASLYYLSQSSSFSLLGLRSSSEGLQPLQEYRYVSLPVLSSDKSVSPLLSSQSRQSNDGSRDGSFGDAQHRLLKVQLNEIHVDSLTKDQVKLLHPTLRIMSVYLKEPTLQIERAYTPLYDVFSGGPSSSSSSSSNMKSTLDLIIKRYEDGELSRHAHRLRPSPDPLQVDEVYNLAHVRGPVETWTWRASELPEEIVLIVGGTGITPAYQLMTNVFGRPSEVQGSSTSTAPAEKSSSSSAAASVSNEPAKPKFTLLYSAPSIESLLLLPEISLIHQANPDRLKVGLWVETDPVSSPQSDQIGNSSLVNYDSSDTWSGSLKSLVRLRKPATNLGPERLNLSTGRIGEKELKNWVGAKFESDGKKKVILVCGPDGMVSAIAGPKGNDGKSQGPIGGILRRLGWSNEDVCKL